ncbi:predicted protein [Sclerotinia sclerotiorum 1980 UF-70]|uniref:Uncharacterized protein n=1 Tax=Sclerotinia sclerotiorum (strain ATCC 18683 / 1980 / Ss-1) TaxID=665079 RepID=A7ECR2_SCLS1|nr:predicted protein [Sclerotinia sclerotiorum 1980 UF-70]EDO00241.1 predicted protein [Sclerotinia sclerotiorum 1980 UF-70]
MWKEREREEKEEGYRRGRTLVGEGGIGKRGEERKGKKRIIWKSKVGREMKISYAT